MKKLVDLADPFFAPVWVRVAVVAVLFGWGLFELSMGKAMWAVIFLGMSVICTWRFYTIDYTKTSED